MKRKVMSLYGDRVQMGAAVKEEPVFYAGYSYQVQGEEVVEVEQASIKEGEVKPLILKVKR